MRGSFSKLFATSGLLLFLTGCATVSPPLPPSLDLPKPPGDLRAVRKGERVTLTWTIPTITTDRQRARSFGAIRICRAVNSESTDCKAVVGEITVAPPAGNLSGKKAAGSYSDMLPGQLQSDDPSSFATYAVEVRNAAGRSAGLSNLARVPLVRTLPPPKDVAARVAKEGVVLSWTSSLPAAEPNAPVRYDYRIYRRPLDSPQSILVAEVPPSADQSSTFTDSTVEWQKKYEYRVDAVTVIVRTGSEEKIEGDDSAEISVFADDVFPPAVPSGLQAVFSGPGQKPFVDLIWAPVPDVDLDGYNVYRHEQDSAPVKLNSAPVKTPAYRDHVVVSGKHYFYSVSAVDVHGNESAPSETAEENVP